jgi:hypothetical protein
MASTRQAVLHELLERFVEAERREAKDETAGPAGTQGDLKRELEAAYWAEVTSVVEGFVRDDLPKDIDVSEEDRLFLSFAVFDHPRLAEAVVRVALWQPPSDSDFSLQFMLDALRSAYRDALRLETLAKLRQKLETVDSEIEDWPEVNLEYVKYRDRLVAEALGSSPQGQHLLRQYSELDERLEEFKTMERRNQSEGWESGEERKQWLAVKTYMEQRYAEIARVLDPLAKKARGIKEELAKLEAAAAQATREVREHERELSDLEASQKSNIEGTRGGERHARQLDFVREALKRAQEQQRQARSQADSLKKEHAELLKSDGIAASGDAVVAIVDHLLELRNERRLVEAQIRDEETTVHQTTPADVRSALMHEIGNVRGLLRLAAKYARVGECVLPLSPKAAAVNPASLIDSLREIEQIDPGLFNNQGVKRFGKPSILLAPGIGDGVYDQDRNRLVIPQYTPRSPLESVANAIVLYRLDADAAYNDRRLFKSYQTEIKEYAQLRSNLKLRQNLTRDYLIWVTREARGQQELSREVRDWFEANIAPRKDEPLVPRELRGLGSRQLKGKLDEVERSTPSGERSFRSAMLRWLQDVENEETLKVQVLPLLEEAMRQAPGNLDYVYSAGALYKRARMYPQAIDCFTRYAANARKSWWTNKAVELCAACR